MSTLTGKPAEAPKAEAPVVQTNPMKSMLPSPTGILDRMMSDQPITRTAEYTITSEADVKNSSISYVLFMEPSDLTKNPVAGGCCAFLLSRLGAFDWNRLKHMRDGIFPMLDGPVQILQLSSMAVDNSFIVLNNADKNQPLPRSSPISVAGVVRRNMLYKLLPKENIYVPASDWAEEVERSEIGEVLRALQLVGALIVDYEHVPCGKQPNIALPVTGNPLGNCVAWAKSKMRFFGGGSKGSGGTLGSTKHKATVDASPLTGRVVFRLNARPINPVTKEPITLDQALAQLGNDFYYLKRQPAILTRLKLRMERGIMMKDYFTMTHYTPDSCFLIGMKKLQYESVPKDCGVETIDCGWSADARKRNETRFGIVYPDMKDAEEARQSGLDLAPETKAIFPAGKLHPLCSMNSLDELGRHAEAPKAAKDEEEEEGDKKKKKSDEEKEGDSEAVKAVKADLVDAKRALYETSAEAYLNKSMLEYVMTVKGLGAPPANDGFKLPGAKGKGGMFGGGKGGMLGSLNGLLVKFNPIGKKGGVISAVDAEPESDEEDDGAAIPAPIDPSRPSMGLIGKHVKASGTGMKAM